MTDIDKPLTEQELDVEIVRVIESSPYPIPAMAGIRDGVSALVSKLRECEQVGVQRGQQIDALQASLVSAQEALRVIADGLTKPQNPMTPAWAASLARMALSRAVLAGTAERQEQEPECICPNRDTILGNCPYHGGRGWGNVTATAPLTGRAGTAEPPAKPES